MGLISSSPGATNNTLKDGEMTLLGATFWIGPAFSVISVDMFDDDWLVVEPIHLKKYANVKMGSFPQVSGRKSKNVGNHHPDDL